MARPPPRRLGRPSPPGPPPTRGEPAGGSLCLTRQRPPDEVEGAQRRPSPALAHRSIANGRVAAVAVRSRDDELARGLAPRRHAGDLRAERSRAREERGLVRPRQHDPAGEPPRRAVDLGERTRDLAAGETLRDGEPPAAGDERAAPDASHPV